MLQKTYHPIHSIFKAFQSLQGYHFSNRKQEGENLDHEHDDLNHERNTQAEEANPTLEQKAQTFSYLRLGWRIFLWSSIGLFSYNMYLNNTKTVPQNEFGYIEFFSQSAKSWQQTYQDSYDFFTKPPLDKLLPDIPELPPGYEIPKTLVINLTGTIVHTDFVFGKGYSISLKIRAEIMKRPGLTKFLKKLSQLYEIVVLTDDESMFTQSICEKLDPQHQMFAGRFGRECMVLERNKYLKDIKYLNRPLNRIIVVDSKSDRLVKCLDNSIILDEFKGTNGDNALIDLLPLLEFLAKPEVKDIRSELRKYGNDNPQTKFKEEQKVRELNMKNQMQKGVLGVIGSMAQQKKSGSQRFIDNNKRIG